MEGQGGTGNKEEESCRGWDSGNEVEEAFEEWKGNVEQWLLGGGGGKSVVRKWRRLVKSRNSGKEVEEAL